MDKIKIISIIGPTASGKTSLSIAVAKKYNGEIVSADSMQIYKDMDIGTAKPTVEEMDGIKHYMMDFLPPSTNYSVADYVRDANSAIKEILDKNKLPILVGGTGLYVDSLLNNVQFTEQKVDEQLRENLNSKSDEELLLELEKVDKDSYDKLSKEINHKRIARALEVFYLTGKPKSQVDKEAMMVESPYKPIKIGLYAEDRQFIYDRINQRVDIMVQQGVLEEAKNLMNSNLSLTAQKAIGYKEFFPYLNGEDTLENCIETLKMNTRRYAKRQLTWFKRDKNIKWFDICKLNSEELIKNVFEYIDEAKDD